MSVFRSERTDLISSIFGVIDITFERIIPGTKLKLDRFANVFVGGML